VLQDIELVSGKRRFETIRMKWILFESERLPAWAQLLDLAAQMALNSSETRAWFSRFTHGSGVDDARSVVKICGSLRASLHANRQAVVTEVGRESADSDASAVIASWVLALDTMIRKASSLKTCSWLVEEGEDLPSRPHVGGGLTRTFHTARRVSGVSEVGTVRCAVPAAFSGGTGRAEFRTLRGPRVHRSAPERRGDTAARCPYQETEYETCRLKGRKVLALYLPSGRQGSGKVLEAKPPDQ
jgi:hypothetical protein